jgi:hypothetical protein
MIVVTGPRLTITLQSSAAGRLASRSVKLTDVEKEHILAPGPTLETRMAKLGSGPAKALTTVFRRSRLVISGIPGIQAGTVIATQ